MATQPFEQKHPVVFLLGLATVLLAAAAVLMVVTYVLQHDLPSELTTRQSQLQANLAVLNTTEVALREILQGPTNNKTFERSMFLNRLLQRKGISWTKTFADLESILPPRVQMMQIRPEVTAFNTITLSMQVGAEMPVDFVTFLKALENSILFDSPNLRSSAFPNDNQPLFRYQLTVNYAQKL